METKEDFIKPFVLGMYFAIVWYFFCYYVIIPWLFPSKKSTSPPCGNSGREITDDMIDASGKVCIALGRCTPNPGFYVTRERVTAWKNHIMKNADKLFRIERVVPSKIKTQPKKSKRGK